MKLQVLPLSQEAFSAYGDVIETQKRDFFHINNGLVERYHDLALVEILEQDRTLISINRATGESAADHSRTRTSSAGYSGLYPDER